MQVVVFGSATFPAGVGVTIPTEIDVAASPDTDPVAAEPVVRALVATVGRGFEHLPLRWRPEVMFAGTHDASFKHALCAGACNMDAVPRRMLDCARWADLVASIYERDDVDVTVGMWINTRPTISAATWRDPLLRQAARLARLAMADRPWYAAAFAKYGLHGIEAVFDAVVGDAPTQFLADNPDGARLTSGGWVVGRQVVDSPALVGMFRNRMAGSRCRTCGEEVRERPLLVGSYVGCLCG